MRHLIAFIVCAGIYFVCSLAWLAMFGKQHSYLVSTVLIMFFFWLWPKIANSLKSKREISTS